MEFRILGPLEVRLEGGTLKLGAAKQRALLGILLLHANEVVSSDRLVDNLWGARPPDTAANAVQVYVAQLRKSLEPARGKGEPSEALLTRPGGYMLRVEPGRLDAERFEELVARGTAAADARQPEQVAEVLGEALSLWRGDPLADFTYEPFAQADIARLEELRLGALELRIDADLALGRHGALVGELEALVREHPLRERLRGQLMLALYRAGRQAEALQVYRDARTKLTEELGIEPGPDLQRLEGAILRQDSELELPAGVSAQPPPRGELPPEPETRKTVTVLVAMRAARAGADPEAARRVDERYLEAATRAVERHGGAVQSTLGDRVMAVFGVPRVHEDDALRAARAAVELPGGQAGVATGEVVSGGPAAERAAIAGEPVAQAAELAEAAPAGGVLLAEETHGFLGDAVRATRAEAKDGPAWRLVDLVPRPPPLSQSPETPIVGRRSELAQLTGALERAAGERTVHLFTILGPAGIGKTRLAEEFASRVAPEATVLAGRCVPYGEGITFWPLREIVGRLAAAAPLPALLSGEEAGDLVAERITEAIGRADATSSVAEIFWAFRRLLETIARERPLLLVFEDVHWAEPTLLDFLEYLAERLRDSPVLLLCLARPELVEERPGWGGGKRNASSLFLERLSEAESERLIEALAGGLPASTRARVREAAEGNPLFLEQILAMLTEEPAPEGEVPIPPTIQAVLAARLDRLGPGERAVIERAAVVGKEFIHEAVADLVPDDARPFASRHLDALVDKELLDPAPANLSERGAFRFRHVLIQQSTYRAIPKRVRAALHERAAAWLERAVGESTPEFAETAGYHLEQTYRYRSELGALSDEDRALGARAATLLATAGRRAFQRGDMPASVNLLDRATSLLVDDDRQRGTLLPDLGYALFDVGELERANTVLSEAVELGRASDDRGVEWKARAKLAHARMHTDPEPADPDYLIREATAAIEVLDDLDDDLGVARALCLLSDAHWPRGEMVAAADAALAARERARRAGSRRDESWGLGAYAYALLRGPTPAADAARDIEAMLSEAEGNLVLEANLLGFLAAHEAMSDRRDDARAHIAQSCERLRELGLMWQLGIQEQLGAYIELFAGDPAAAEHHLRSAWELFASSGDRWSLSTIAVDLPRPVYEQGRHDEALALVEAIAEAPAPADCEWQIKRRGVHARLLARGGRIEEAERLAGEGVAIAAETDQPWFHADVLVDLADVLWVAGRAEEAAGAAKDAVRLYRAKGIAPSAERTLAFLEELRRTGVGAA